MELVNNQDEYTFLPFNLGKRVRLFFSIAFVVMLSSCNKERAKEQSKVESPLEKLKEGNRRFVSGYPIHPDETLQRIKDLKKGQHPFAVVVSCSDSRIPPELIFDQGLGDIFTIRTAGNVIGDYELGSIEYAVEHLHCDLVVVLGHENCGAIEAFVNSGHERHKDHIQTIVDYIANEKEEIAIMDKIKAEPDLAVRANIKHGVVTVQNAKPILNSLYKAKKIHVMGAYYDLDTGEVIFNTK
jgi:carbonic anhydrase